MTAYSYFVSIARALPTPIFRVVRSTAVGIYGAFCLWSNLLWLAFPRGAITTRDSRNPFGIIGQSALRSIYWSFIRNPYELLQIRTVRQILAHERLKVLTKSEEVRTTENTANVVYNGIQHNVAGAKSAAGLDRPSLMVNVLCSIERIWKNFGTLDVLSIGPRSEIEIFSLLAAGFKGERIRALDLISYSPYVDVGNMHA